MRQTLSITVNYSGTHGFGIDMQTCQKIGDRIYPVTTQTVWGVSEDKIRKLADSVQAGKYIVIESHQSVERWPHLWMSARLIPTSLISGVSVAEGFATFFVRDPFSRALDFEYTVVARRVREELAKLITIGVLQIGDLWAYSTADNHTVYRIR